MANTEIFLRNIFGTTRPNVSVRQENHCGLN